MTCKRSQVYSDPSSFIPGELYASRVFDRVSRALFSFFLFLNTCFFNFLILISFNELFMHVLYVWVRQRA